MNFLKESPYISALIYNYTIFVNKMRFVIYVYACIKFPNKPILMAMLWIYSILCNYRTLKLIKKFTFT